MSSYDLCFPMSFFRMTYYVVSKESRHPLRLRLPLRRRPGREYTDWAEKQWIMELEEERQAKRGN